VKLLEQPLSAPFISLEFFPPKDQTDWFAFFKTVDRLAVLKPLFASVTYGAGGGTQANTLEIVRRFKLEHGLEPMSHLTCVGAREAALSSFLESLLEAGIDNVLALRGDPPKDAAEGFCDNPQFQHASDLVSFIKKNFPQIGIGVAGYPEGHAEAESADADMRWLKHKLDQGGQFVVSQLFFDNQRYLEFVAKARAAGITSPIVPGILPIMNLKTVTKIAGLCGAHIPAEFLRQLEEADRSGGSAAVLELGISYAEKQCRELLEAGAPGIHLYTLNKSEACLELAGRLGFLAG
jgi:methylenetetrahydrofolate reductase (NADPH)